LFFLFFRSKRAAYKYAKDRGAVASRWCWLATQISELDYKIRQLTDLRKHVRDTKGSVTLETIGGFEGQLPGGNSYAYNIDSESDEGDGVSSARTRPYLQSSFRKRKLVQIANLHQVSKKAARPR
jgi:KAT8 regulatory NSL complex subunit 1